MNAALKGILAAIFAGIVVIGIGFYVETTDLRRAVEKQADEGAAELETMTSRISRDLRARFKSSRAD
jgi:predicted nucleic acid-binding Zn ribbon protein